MKVTLPPASLAIWFTAQKRIDLVIAPDAAVTSYFNAFGVTCNFLFANQVDSVAPQNFFQLQLLGRGMDDL